jgi:hypothetical protein
MFPVPMRHTTITKVFLSASKKDTLDREQVIEANLSLGGPEAATLAPIPGDDQTVCQDLSFSVFIRNRAQYFSVTFWCSRTREHSSVTRDNQQQKE